MIDQLIPEQINVITNAIKNNSAGNCIINANSKLSEPFANCMSKQTIAKIATKETAKYFPAKIPAIIEIKYQISNIII